MSVDDLLSLANGETPVSLPSEIDQLRAEGVPATLIEELAAIWPDLLPEDRRDVVDYTRWKWEQRRRREHGNDARGTEPIPST